MGFQYNGISSQSMNIKARLTGWQMVPALRSNTETVPGKAGLADFGADSGERYIDVSCNVYPQKTFAGLVAVLDRAAAWLSGGGMVRPYGGDKTACTGRCAGPVFYGPAFRYGRL